MITSQEFFASASLTNKAFRLEAFSFTFQSGLNIYFDNYDELQSIVKGTEFEFWQLEVQSEGVEVEVKNLKDLQTILEKMEEGSYDVSQLEVYAAIVEGGYSTWENAQAWHEDNYFTDYTNDYDFGHYLMHEVNCIEVPEALQGYIDYEQYGKDALINDFMVIDDSIYSNH